MWPSTWQFGWFQNINVCNNETHIDKYWLHPKRTWTHRALPSSGCNIWTRFWLVTGRLKWLSCGRCHLISQQLIPWPQPLNEIIRSLYAKGGSSGRRTSQLYRHYLWIIIVIKGSNWISVWHAIWSGFRARHVWRRLVDLTYVWD